MDYKKYSNERIDERKRKKDAKEQMKKVIKEFLESVCK